MLALTRISANETLPRPRTGDAVFFDLPSLGLIVYPESLAIPLAVVALVLVGDRRRPRAARCRCGRRDGDRRRRRRRARRATDCELDAAPAVAHAMGRGGAVERRVRVRPGAVRRRHRAGALRCCSALGAGAWAHAGVLVVWLMLAVASSVEAAGRELPVRLAAVVRARSRCSSRRNTLVVRARMGGRRRRNAHRRQLAYGVSAVMLGVVGTGRDRARGARLAGRLPDRARDPTRRARRRGLWFCRGLRSQA